MIKSSVLEKMTFSDYYRNQSSEEKKRIRNAFIEESGIEFPTFYSKLNSGRYSKLEQNVLERICSTEFIWK